MKWSKAEKMCYNKRRYPSMIVANCNIGKIKTKYPTLTLTDFRSYECPVCRGFHITKKNKMV